MCGDVVLMGLTIVILYHVVDVYGCYRIMKMAVVVMGDCDGSVSYGGDS